MQNRENLIKNIKTGGNIVMYIGSAGLMSNAMNQVRKNHNPVVNGCIVMSSAVLSLGLGKLASGWLEKAVDDIVAFIDDVKSSGKKESKNDG